MKWLFCGLCTLSAALTVLHFTGIATYTRTIKIYIAALGLFALISFVMIAAKFKKMTFLNKIALITMLFFMLINTLFFIFVSTLGNQSFLAKIGLLLYIFIAIANGLNKLMEGFFKEREAELLHEIAYTDNLTQLGNRYALERDVQKMPLESVSIVSLDLNYLKYTNDTFGHSGGDVLLKAAAACISSVYDKVYRVGGDEFIALMEQTDHTLLDSFADNLQKKIMQFNEDRTNFEAFAEHEDFVLSIAAGYASHQTNDISYEQIMNRADEKMYAVKKRIHAENGRIPIQKGAGNHQS
ncbi:MAG: GGDEF domain-containing protein [Oscillospiraceae bacterium]|nr:GGDEF domain-containing protein [Oscillospiraceae bacterium]